MKYIFILSLLFPLTAFAQKADPTPKPEEIKIREEIDIKGAIKVEDKPLFTPDAINSEATPETKEESSKRHHFGVHGAVGLPHPLNFGVTYVHDSDLFSAQIATGSFKTKISDIDAKIGNTEIGLRWHPWAGTFFAGVLYGNQNVDAEKTESLTGFGDIRAWGKVKSNYLTPHVGWMWGKDNGGFFASFEVGYQSPSGVSVEVDSNAPQAARSTADYRRIEKEVRDEAEKIGKKSIPSIALLKIGWLF